MNTDLLRLCPESDVAISNTRNVDFEFHIGSYFRLYVTLIAGRWMRRLVECLCFAVQRYLAPAPSLPDLYTVTKYVYTSGYITLCTTESSDNATFYNMSKVGTGQNFATMEFGNFPRRKHTFRFFLATLRRELFRLEIGPA